MNFFYLYGTQDFPQNIQQEHISNYGVEIGYYYNFVTLVVKACNETKYIFSSCVIANSWEVLWNILQQVEEHNNESSPNHHFHKNNEYALM